MKFFKKALVAFLSVVMVCLSASCSLFKAHNRAFDNVIVVIGDGMGENHILNAIDYFNLDIPVFVSDQKGYIGTNSLSGVTDSAAAGTALATGQRVINGNVAWYDGENIQQITEIAKDKGMKVGIVTTDTLNGATPAAFSAHAADRSDTLPILTAQVDSGIDLFLGKYSSGYLGEAFSSKGYTLAANKDDLQEAKNSKKLVGVFEDVGSNYIDGRAHSTSVQLKEMAKFAVEYLENKKGFFLMIEGAYIDKYSHSNDFHSAMSEVRSLFDTIEFLYEYASDGKTAIFITADHETGGLQRMKPEEDVTGLYTSENHTGAPVPLFVKNYMLNIEKFGYTATQTPENTIVFEACKAIIQGK